MASTPLDDSAAATTVAFGELPSLVGKHLGRSGWHEITQERVNLFADATGDHQWIHVDPERARSGPFGGPIAHGYLTLSMAVVLLDEVLTIDGLDQIVNYGLNKVRFPAPVPAGSRVQVSATLADAEEVNGAGIQATIDAVMRAEGIDKPVCIAQMVHRYYKA